MAAVVEADFPRFPEGQRSNEHITNRANVSSTTPDDNDAINDEAASLTSKVAAVADLQLAKSGPARVVAGIDITYTITLTNAGPSDAQSVSLTDSVPRGTSFVSATPMAGSNPDGFSYTQAGGTVTGTPTGGVVAAGHQDKFILVVHVLSSDANGSSISNTATVTTTTTDDSDTFIDSNSISTTFSP
jgi:uncharacterized repeat protein (TIGR01451 family)